MKTISFFLQFLPVVFLSLLAAFTEKLSAIAFFAVLIAFFGGAYQILHTVIWLIAKHKLNLHQYGIFKTYLFSLAVYVATGICLLVVNQFFTISDKVGVVYLLAAAPLYLLHTYFSYCVAFEKQAFERGNNFLNNIQL